MWPRRSVDRPITDEDLSAFADGQLPRRRAARVAAHLRECPADADRIHAYWRQEAAIYHAYAQTPREPAADLESPHPTDPGGKAWLPRAAAAVGALALIVTSGWQWLGGASTPSGPTFAAIALQAYERPLEGDEQSVPATAPRLPGTGLTPVAHRRIEGVEEFVYRGADGTRLALYATDGGSSGDADSFEMQQRGDARLVEWVAGDKRYALVGRKNLPNLTRLAVRARSMLVAPSHALADAPSGSVGVSPGERVLDTGNGESFTVQPPTGSAQPEPASNGPGDT